MNLLPFQFHSHIPTPTPSIHNSWHSQRPPPLQLGHRPSSHPGKTRSVIFRSRWEKSSSHRSRGSSENHRSQKGPTWLGTGDSMGMLFLSRMIFWKEAPILWINHDFFCVSLFCCVVFGVGNMFDNTVGLVTLNFPKPVVYFFVMPSTGFESRTTLKIFFFENAPTICPILQPCPINSNKSGRRCLQEKLP